MSGQLLNSERGITILETTVILSVLFILAGAMSPIVSESVNTARAVKAKNDASMIALGLINLQKDVGPTRSIWVERSTALGQTPHRACPVCWPVKGVRPMSTTRRPAKATRRRSSRCSLRRVTAASP